MLENNEKSIINKNIIPKEKTEELSSEKINSILRKKNRSKYDIKVLDITDSTNEEIKKLVTTGAEHGLVVISDCQTAGKGRRGRAFFSPKGCGLYISMLFKPEGKEAEDVISITTQAAVAVSLAIEEVYGKTTNIKWVNDVWLGNKKVCGILAESISGVESEGIDSVVVGIGINVIKPDVIPNELKDVIGFIFDSDVSETKEADTGRNELAASVIAHMYDLYEALPDKSYLEEYKKRSLVLGKRIRFGASPDATENTTEGVATGITDDAGLIVKLDDGTEQILHTGEITLRTVD
ncbi:MAG: biotin--[acetyl-CoA-carboxylase] ligase [Eubacterium sp.]|nr:biotin--[acetyl-CoA-carboxylase] ligase [Eubacterium sp.]